MPFLDQVTDFINKSLQNTSLKKASIQPAEFHGLSSQLVRKKLKADKKITMETVPAIITGKGISEVITPDSKIALQVYHKLYANVYSYEKKSYGSDHYVKQISELAMVVISNSELTGVPKESIEPAIAIGLPQHAEELRNKLKLMRLLITPIGSNMDHVQVFKQEYPQSDYFLNEHTSMFLMKYRVEMLFDQDCVDHWLC